VGIDREEHSYTGNCCSGPYPTEMCEDHADHFRGECPKCPPCPACDQEWNEAAQREARP
jgi:hypothetical protein